MISGGPFMTVTILAIVFMILLLVIVILGYRGVITRGKPAQSSNEERCSICGKYFGKAQLAERQVGDYRLLFFCSSCIMGLYNEITSKN
jgi:hypothetical protein